MDEQAVFQLLRAALFEEDENVDIEDWRCVFEEMKAQSVAALPGMWLKKHPIEGADAWQAFCLYRQGHWLKVMNGQDQLLKLLEEHGIPCVVIKGMAAAVEYPYPSLRTMGDVDILVKRADFEKAAAVTEANGYQVQYEKNPKGHHYCYRKDGIDFELHKRPGVIRETEEDLLSLIEQGIDEREFRECNGYRFPVLPAELNGLVLMAHINQHLRGGLGLRQIIDWMMYLDELPEDIREEELMPLLRDTGMEKLALTVTAMCRKYLGSGTIVDNTEDYPCDELMDYIMTKGNFGGKAGSDGKISSVFFDMADPARVFRRLQNGGLGQWKAARKYRFLRPFAWMYQSFYILGYFMRHRVGPGALVRQREKGLEERELIGKLGLKIDRDIEFKKEELT